MMMIVTENVVESVPSRGQTKPLYFHPIQDFASRCLLVLLACPPMPDAEERFLLVERRLRDIVVRALRNPALVGFVEGLESLLGEFTQVCRAVGRRSPQDPRHCKFNDGRKG